MLSFMDELTIRTKSVVPLVLKSTSTVLPMASVNTQPFAHVKSYTVFRPCLSDRFLADEKKYISHIILFLVL